MKKFSLIICYFVFFHTVVNALQCVRDKHITKDDTEVDWWITIKMPQYMDLYLYYDSIMDAAQEKHFKEGYFLRSEDSAFGRALDNLNQDEPSFIAYNDHFLKNLNGKEYDRPTTFYNRYPDGVKINNEPLLFTRGAHEKGILAWNGTQGFWIQHTLPNFPNILAPDKDKGPHDITDIKFNVVKGPLNYPKDTMDFLRFSYLGWPNLFPPNIANPYIIPEKGPFKPFIKSPSYRPAQHFVCVSLPSMADVELLHKKLSNMLPFTSKDFMIKRGKRDDKVDGPLFTTFAQQPNTTVLPNNQRNPALYFQLPIKQPKYEFMVYNSYLDAKLKFKSVWSKLRCTDNEIQNGLKPCLSKDELMYMSSYVETNPSILDKKYLFANFLVTFNKGPQPFYYGLGLHQKSDHSKLGFTEDKESSKVCLTGGNVLDTANLYAAGSSIMICINSAPLRTAFSMLLESAFPSNDYKLGDGEFNLFKHILSINGVLDIYADNAINIEESDIHTAENPGTYEFQTSLHFNDFIRNKFPVPRRYINIKPADEKLIIAREYTTETLYESIFYKSDPKLRPKQPLANLDTQSKNRPNSFFKSRGRPIQEPSKGPPIQTPRKVPPTDSSINQPPLATSSSPSSYSQMDIDLVDFNPDIFVKNNQS